MDVKSKRVVFCSDTLNIIRSFPSSVTEKVGRALRVAQDGGKSAGVKPLKGFAGSSVLEIRERADDGTYRVVYTTEIKNIIVVLHAFKKKSVRGIETPKHEIDLVKQRLQDAKEQFHG